MGLCSKGNSSYIKLMCDSLHLMNTSIFFLPPPPRGIKMPLKKGIFVVVGNKRGNMTLSSIKCKNETIIPSIRLSASWIWAFCYSARSRSLSLHWSHSFFQPVVSIYYLPFDLQLLQFYEHLFMGVFVYIESAWLHYVCARWSVSFFLFLCWKLLHRLTLCGKWQVHNI